MDLFEEQPKEKWKLNGLAALWVLKSVQVNASEFERVQANRRVSKCESVSEF